MNVKKCLASIISGLVIIGSVSYSPQNNTIVPSSVSYAESINGIEVWDGKVDISWYDDQETEFHINTAQEFAGIAALTNKSQKSFEGKTIYIEKDIYLNEFENRNRKWTTIGRVSNTLIYEFKGNIEGNNHVIYNYYNECGGLIHNLSGSIKNLRMVNARIDTVSSQDYSSYVGGICNRSIGIIENCCYQGDLIIYNPNRTKYVGGICGYIDQGQINDCIFNGTIAGNNSYNIGGICGYMLYSRLSCSIENCHSFGSVRAYADYEKYIGGICGSIHNPNSALSTDNKVFIKNCSNNCEVICTPNYSNELNFSFIGGICGRINCNNKLKKCHCEIENCYNTGSIIYDMLERDSDSYKVGGIVGSLENYTSIENVYNIGSVWNCQEMCSRRIPKILDRQISGSVVSQHS